MKNVKRTKQVPIFIQKINKAKSFAEKFKTLQDKFLNLDNNYQGKSPLLKKQASHRVRRIKMKRKRAFKKAFPQLAKKIQDNAQNAETKLYEAIKVEYLQHKASLKRPFTSKRSKKYTLNGYRTKYSQTPNFVKKSSNSNRSNVKLSVQGVSSTIIAHNKIFRRSADKVRIKRRTKQGEVNMSKKDNKIAQNTISGTSSQLNSWRGAKRVGKIASMRQRGKIWALFFEDKNNALGFSSN